MKVVTLKTPSMHEGNTSTSLTLSLLHAERESGRNNFINRKGNNMSEEMTKEEIELEQKINQRTREVILQLGFSEDALKALLEVLDEMDGELETKH